MIRKQIVASSLIEVIVSMLIILLAFGIFTSISVRIVKNDSIVKSLNDYYLSRKLLMDEIVIESNQQSKPIMLGSVSIIKEIVDDSLSFKLLVIHNELNNKPMKIYYVRSCAYSDCDN